MDIKWIYKFHLYNISIGKHFQVSKSKKLERVESSPLLLSYDCAPPIQSRSSPSPPYIITRG